MTTATATNSEMNGDGAGAPFSAIVADHDPGQTRMLGAVLARLGGVAVTAGDAAGLWQALDARTFDLAIIDLDMPELDAPALLETMRGHPRSRHLPTIVLTAAPPDTGPLLPDGASAFMLKPIDAAVFGRHVDVLMRTAAAARQERMAARRAIAVHRATEAILGNLAGEATVGAAWLDDEVDALRRVPLPPDAAAAVMHRVNRISRECRALQDHVGKAAAAIRSLGEKVTVGDRSRTLEAMIADAVADAAAAGPASERRIAICLPAGATLVACDADSLQQALAHLLRNALQHSPAGMAVSVSATIYPDGLLGIEVTDHGRGMHPDALARTFAPLQARLDGSRAGPYMGFGLLFAKAVAEAHGGTLELRSMPDQGTTALLTLPPDRVRHSETSTSPGSA